jgi:hypothetical protein
VKYAVLSGSIVDPALRAAAEVGRDFAAAHLGIEPPALVFFAERSTGAGPQFLSSVFEAPQPIVGISNAESWTIGVRSDVDAALAVEAGAHETFHVAQGGESDDRELAATAYGRWAREVICPLGIAHAAHVLNEFPYGGTLRDAASTGDVVIARYGDGHPSVFRNLGSRSWPEWHLHRTPCPVPLPTPTRQRPATSSSPRLRSRGTAASRLPSTASSSESARAAEYERIGREALRRSGA